MNRNDLFDNMTFQEQEIALLEKIADEFFHESLLEGTIKKKNGFTYSFLVDISDNYPERNVVSDVFVANVFSNKVLTLFQTNGYEIKEVSFHTHKKLSVFSNYKFTRLHILYC